MTDRTDPPDQRRPERADRRTVLNYLLAGINSGLPAFERIRFDEADPDATIYIDFDRAADIEAWAGELNLNVLDGRPHPIDPDYVSWTVSGLTAEAGGWRGWTVYARSGEPITEEHVRGWVDSGKAARRAAYLAQQGGDVDA